MKTLSERVLFQLPIYVPAYWDEFDAIEWTNQFVKEKDRCDIRDWAELFTWEEPPYWKLAQRYVEKGPISAKDAEDWQAIQGYIDDYYETGSL